MFVLKAEDEDSGSLGQVEYRLIPDETGAFDYFTVDKKTGSVRTKRSLDTVKKDALPLRFTVEARDNPSSDKDFNVAQTQVVVSIETKLNSANYLI